MWPSRGDHEATPLDRAAWFVLRALVVGLGVVAAMWVAARLRVVLLPVALALLIAAPLRPVSARLGRVLGRSAAAVLPVLALVVGAITLLGLAGQAVASDADELRIALTEGVDDVERWLVDGPLDLERSRIDELRGQIGDSTPGLLGGVTSGAVRAAEAAAGTLLALVLAVFVLRDADRAVDALASRWSARRAARLQLGSAAAWQALRRYLLGATVLGVLEAAVIGTAVALTGSPLAIPVATFTLLAAFVPIVGAVLAGVVAVLASLVEGGPAAAAVVAAVCIVVQQLDGDVLAPLVYGRATRLHPVAVLLALTTGTALAGLPGAVLAVPITTVVVAVSRAIGDDAVAAEVRGAGAAAESNLQSVRAPERAS